MPARCSCPRKRRSNRSHPINASNWPVKSITRCPAASRWAVRKLRSRSGFSFHRRPVTTARSGNNALPHHYQTQGILVLSWVFCYCARELKPHSKSSFARNIPILIATVVIALVCLAQALPRFFPKFDLFQRLEWMTYDWRMRLAACQPRSSGNNLFGGVFVDDTALKSMNDGSLGYRFSWPWPRLFYGRLVRELKAQGAACVGFDILFDQLQPPDPATVVKVEGQPPMASDEFFARQIRAADNVVLAAESG